MANEMYFMHTVKKRNIYLLRVDISRNNDIKSFRISYFLLEVELLLEVLLEVVLLLFEVQLVLEDEVPDLQHEVFEHVLEP